MVIIINTHTCNWSHHDKFLMRKWWNNLQFTLAPPCSSNTWENWNIYRCQSHCRNGTGHNLEPFGNNVHGFCGHRSLLYNLSVYCRHFFVVHSFQVSKFSRLFPFHPVMEAFRPNSSMLNFLLPKSPFSVCVFTWLVKLSCLFTFLNQAVLKNYLFFISTIYFTPANCNVCLLFSQVCLLGI